MPKPSRSLAVTVTKPAALTVATAPPSLTEADHQRLIADTVADVKAYEGAARSCAALAFRNGCRLLAYQAAMDYKRGKLTAFVRLLKTQGIPERTVWSHYHVAKAVASALEWLDDKDRVKDGVAIGLIYSTPQAAFLAADQGGELPEPLRLAAEHLSGRSIADVLKELGEDHDAPGRGLPPPGKGGDKKTVKTVSEELEALADAQEAAGAMQEFLATPARWQVLPDEELITAQVNVETWLQELKQHLQRHKRKPRKTPRN